MSQLAARNIGIESETRGASLESWIAPNTEPISDAALFNAYWAVGDVLANGMLLAIGDIVWPVAGMGGVVI